MAPVWIDTTLIDKQKSSLDKLEKQSKSWILFFVVSNVCLLILITLGYIVNSDILQTNTYYFIFSILGVCIFWWIWTINFICHAVRNQKIIFALLMIIEKEIKNIKTNIVNKDDT
jgi:hypothetical protein